MLRPTLNPPRPETPKEKAGTLKQKPSGPAGLRQGGRLGEPTCWAETNEAAAPVQVAVPAVAVPVAVAAAVVVVVVEVVVAAAAAGGGGVVVVVVVVMVVVVVVLPPLLLLLLLLLRLLALLLLALRLMMITGIVMQTAVAITMICDAINTPGKFQDHCNKTCCCCFLPQLPFCLLL